MRQLNLTLGSKLIRFTHKHDYNFVKFLHYHILGFEMAEGGKSDPKDETLPNQAKRLIIGLPNFEYQLEEYCSSGHQHMTILLCGKTGVGKSHLTNALIGKRLAKEGEDLDPETYEVGKEDRRCITPLRFPLPLSISMRCYASDPLVFIKVV